jgi:hypothetical protein
LVILALLLGVDALEAEKKSDFQNGINNQYAMVQ